MKSISRCLLLFVCLGGVSLSIGWKASSVLIAAEQADSQEAWDAFPSDVDRISLPVARRQAQLLHTSMHSALQLTHHRLYREDEGLPIPAAVVREMFEEIESEHPVRLRWLVVEGQAMNTDHVAKTPFEKKAVAALKSGKKSYEQIEDGLYRRAGHIRLSNACLKCHVPDRKSTEDRTAGLMIVIPVEAK